MRDIKIEINDSNQTLIKFLNKYFNKAPNSLINKWIRTKKIKVNRNKVNPSSILVEGDIVNIFIYDEEIEKYQEKKVRISSKLNLDIAFESEDIIVIDKPQNVLSHASSKEDYGKNVVDFIIDYLIDSKQYNPRLEKTFKPAIVNRLDRNTMGLVVGAKNRNSLTLLNNSIEKNIKKYYLAIVDGKIDKEIVIENALEKDEKNFVKVSESGKKSKTIVRPVKYSNKYSLVEIELLTGRTHQIRVSLSDIGHSIIGDRRYSKSNGSSQFKDQQLVAYKLKFDNKIELKSLRNKTITSKYEKYIRQLYNKLSREE